MKRNNTEQVGEVIRKLFRQEGLETPLNEYRLVESWGKVVGPVISKYTQNVFIKGQVLHVQLKSSVLRNELMMNRKMLVSHLNDAVGSQVIVDIMFH